MHSEFVSTDPGATAGFVDANRYADLFLGQPFQLTQLAHSLAND
jgi:hypothetical protein